MNKLTTIASIAFVMLLSAGVAIAEHQHKKSPEQVIRIEVTPKGFIPEKIEVTARHPVKLVVTRTTDKTCAKEIVIKDLGIRKELPLNQAVEITFTPKQTGQLRYACAMDMITGVIIVN